MPLTPIITIIVFYIIIIIFMIIFIIVLSGTMIPCVGSPETLLAVVSGVLSYHHH